MLGEETKRQGTNSLVAIVKVSIKPRPFWSDKREIWFIQVEAQFQLSQITSELTKFNHLLVNLLI